jgi:hypothetical protein
MVRGGVANDWPDSWFEHIRIHSVFNQLALNGLAGKASYLALKNTGRKWIRLVGDISHKCRKVSVEVRTPDKKSPAKLAGLRYERGARKT